MRVEVAADATRAARLAADTITDAIGNAIAERGRAAIALSGGTTPKRMLEDLAGMVLPWRDIEVFQVDERIVARDDPARNLGGLLAAFAVREASAAAIHPMPVEAADDIGARQAYVDLLRNVLGTELRLDVVHLGLGGDGHTASLVPGDAALDCHEAIAVTARYHGTRRMTMTLDLINRARLRLWLVTGESKRAVLGRLLARDPELVASRVIQSTSLVIADSAAAGRVPR